MSVATGKNILFCRSEASSEHFADFFRKAGHRVSFFPTFRFEFVYPESIRFASAFLPRLKDADWLLFSSARGVDAFFAHLKNLGIADPHFPEFCIGVVGKKSAERLKSGVSSVIINLQADNLNDLLASVGESANGQQVSVFHITSEQSLLKIKVNTLDNVELNRIPLYRTVKENRHSSQFIKQFASGTFDTIVFGSPTSFEYFFEFPGMPQLLNHAIIATLGSTTAAFIKELGYSVDIVAGKPEPAALQEAVNQYFTTEIFTS